jgi:hypothetical protein
MAARIGNAGNSGSGPSPRPSPRLRGEGGARAAGR